MVKIYTISDLYQHPDGLTFIDSRGQLFQIQIPLFSTGSVTRLAIAFSKLLIWESCTVYYDHCHPSPDSFHSPFPPTQLCVLFRSIKSSLYSPYVLGCVVFHWPWMTAMGYSLHVNCLPLPPITYQSSDLLSEGRSFMPTSHLCAGILSGLSLHGSHAYGLNGCEFTQATAPQFPCSHPWILPLSACVPHLLQWSLTLGEKGWDMAVSLKVENPAVSQSFLCALCRLLHIEASLISSNGTAILVQGFVSSSCSCIILF